MDTISEARLQLVWPVLADKIHTMASMLELEGIEIRVVQGLRTWSDQEALYAQGRSKPGIIVTNAHGGQSYHNFGMAVDCAPSRFGPGHPYDPDWNSVHPYWLRMETVGVSLGLKAGAMWRSFPDAPHFELTGDFPPEVPSVQVKKIYADKGMPGVWEEAGLAV